MRDSDEEARRQNAQKHNLTNSDKKTLIGLAFVVGSLSVLLYLVTASESCRARRNEERFKNMSDADHVKAAFQAMQDNQWSNARTHLYAIKPQTVIEPSPAIKAKIDACFEVTTVNKDDPHDVHAKLELCKEKNDPNYRGYAGFENVGCVTPETQKYSPDERKAIDCTLRPLGCETVVNAEGRKELCPTEAAILLDRVDRTIGALNAMHDKEAKREAEREARDAEASKHKPEPWDLLPVEHTKQMTVMNAGYWNGGEYRVCTIEVGKNPTMLMCPDNTNRRELDFRMDVVFDGSMDHARWDCKRREVDVFCKPFESK